MARADTALIAAIRDALEREADPGRASGAQAYMKSAMPYRGLTAPQLRAVCKFAFAAHPLDGYDRWHATVLTLWRRAAFREERYAAIELSGDNRYRAHQLPAALPLYEEMIVTGAWWDYVDVVAIHRVGPIVRAHPKLKATMRRWSRDPDMWKRRAAIIHQNAYKDATDLELLYACIEPNLADREFFIRKAIGWALRSYAWTDPAEIARYVARNQDRLSGLSRREALKNIERPPLRKPR